MAKIIDFSEYVDNVREKEKADNSLEEQIKKYKENKNIGNYINLKIMYQTKRLQYEVAIEQEEDTQWKKRLGLGFWIALEEYKTRPLIKDFMAEFMLKEIYDDTDEFNLEKHLHSKYRKKDKIERMGAKTYIINSLLHIDEGLSGYLTVNNHLLEDLEKRINKILSRWDQYEKNQHERIMNPENIFEIVDEFVTYNDDCNFSLYDLLLYLKYKLGIDIMNELKIYNNDSEFYIEDVKDDGFSMMDEEYYNITFDHISLKDQKVLSNFNIIMKEYMAGQKIPDSYDYQIYLKEERDKLRAKRKVKNK